MSRRGKPPALKMRIILQNKSESSDQLSLFLKKLGAKHNIPKNIISEVDLALGELVINIIKYGYKNKQNSFISLDGQIKGGKIVLLLKDKGRAFNPLKHKAQDQKTDIEGQAIGGLGIAIAKKSMDSIFYERKDGANCLKLIKLIS